MVCGVAAPTPRVSNAVGQEHWPEALLVKVQPSASLAIAVALVLGALDVEDVDLARRGRHRDGRAIGPRAERVVGSLPSFTNKPSNSSLVDRGLREGAGSASGSVCACSESG